MEKILNQAIEDILNKNISLVEIAVRQRAKFEGWLKFELANELMKQYKDTRVEYPYKTIGIIDLLTNDVLVELKTPNTNYQVDGCEKHNRPITMNINSILDDINKLDKINDREGYIAFVLFPIDDQLYKHHIQKIECPILRKGFSPVKKIVNIQGVNVLVFTSRVK